MNPIVTAPIWLIVVLAFFLPAAAVEDAMRQRIASLTCLGIVALAVIAMALHGFGLSLWQNGAVFVALLALGTAALATGNVGGGDVKLLAATGLWFSLSGALWMVAAVLLSGGVLAAVMIATRGVRARLAGRRSSKRGMIPYGVAIAAGAALVLTSQYRGKQSIYDRLHLSPPVRAAASSG